jgi:hypothetical protein
MYLNTSLEEGKMNDHIMSPAKFFDTPPASWHGALTLISLILPCLLLHLRSHLTAKNSYLGSLHLTLSSHITGCRGGAPPTPNNA